MMAKSPFGKWFDDLIDKGATWHARSLGQELTPLQMPDQDTYQRFEAILMYHHPDISAEDARVALLAFGNMAIAMGATEAADIWKIAGQFIEGPAAPKNDDNISDIPF